MPDNKNKSLKSQAAKLVNKKMKLIPEVSERLGASLNMELCINTIAYAPDIVFKYRYPHFYPDWEATSGLGIYLEGIRKKYYYIGLWLRYYLLHQEELAPILVSEALDTLPFAEITMNYYALAREIVIISLAEKLTPIFTFVTKDNRYIELSAKYWMVLCAIQNCENDLKYGGLLDKAKAKGKTSQCLAGKNYYSNLDDLGSLSVDKIPELPLLPHLGNAIYGLEFNALKLARDYRKFKRSQFENYTRIMRRCFRDIRQPDNKYRMTYINDKGELDSLEQKGKPNPNVKECKILGFIDPNIDNRFSSLLSYPSWHQGDNAEPRQKQDQ